MDPKAINYVVDGALVAGLAAAVYCDVRWGKIFNKITFPCMAAGVLLNTLQSGFGGTLVSLGGLGAAAGLIVGLRLIAGSGFGGGDIKLLAGIGALRGAEFALWAGIFTGLAGGVLALIPLLRQRIFVATLHNLLGNMVVRYGHRTATEITQGSLAGKQPYGVAIGVGALVALAKLGL